MPNTASKESITTFIKMLRFTQHDKQAFSSLKNYKVLLNLTFNT